MRARRYLDRDAVRRLRAEHGYSSDLALADAAGVSADHLGSCLAGRYTAGDRLIDGLLRVLPGASIDDISLLCTVTEIRTPVGPSTRGCRDTPPSRPHTCMTDRQPPDTRPAA